MKIFPTLLLSSVLMAAPVVWAQPIATQTITEVLSLSDFRVALDQIARGQAQNARILLESSQANGEIGPESAAILAYLQEKAGDTARARQTLQGVAAPTQFTTAYLARLGAGPPLQQPEYEDRRTAIPVSTPNETSSNPARLDSTDARIVRLEKMMWGIVNSERASKNLALLSWDERIASIARAHSAEMRDKKYFAHESPTAGLVDPLDRYRAGIGQTPRLVAENIYRAWGSRSFLTERDIRDAHDALMKSPGHRANILFDGPTKMGIGIAANSTGDIWITQMFAKD